MDEQVRFLQFLQFISLLVLIKPPQLMQQLHYTPIKTSNFKAPTLIYVKTFDIQLRQNHLRLRRSNAKRTTDKPNNLLK